MSAWFSADASALAQSIVRGEVSAQEALQRTLADVERINPRLNAVCLVAPEFGFALAEALDRELANHRDDTKRAQLLLRRPFLGVPLVLKDLGSATAHPRLPSKSGSRLFGAGQSWNREGELLRRYRVAGFVPFGRTTTPEFGISATTEALAYAGPTRNPWNLQFSSGGSSGGAAAAVASGLVTLAHASDGAGSIRIPASACGLIGMKPSRGLMPLGPLAGEGWGGLSTEHVLARSVRDTAIALDISAGADVGAPYAAPRMVSGFAKSIATPPRSLRIGLVDSYFEGDPLDVEVAGAVRTFAETLAQCGHRVETIATGFRTLEIVQPVIIVAAAGVAMALEQIATARGRDIDASEVEPSILGALRFGRGLKAAAYLDAVNQLHHLGRRLAQLFERIDLLLTPVLAEPPAQLGRFAMTNPDFLDYRLGPAGLWRYSPFTPLANAAGVPALALPAGPSRLGLPIGAMLTAPFGRDAWLLKVAAQWEAIAGGVEIAPTD